MKAERGGDGKRLRRLGEEETAAPEMGRRGDLETGRLGDGGRDFVRESSRGWMLEDVKQSA